MTPPSHQDPPDTALAQALTKGFTGAVELELLEASAQAVRMRLVVGPEHLQPHGLVHGGVLCTLVETAGSIGASLVAGEGQSAVGVDHHTSFLKPVREGTLTATATPVHVGARSQLWQTDVTDERQRLVASGRLRLMTVPAR